MRVVDSSLIKARAFPFDREVRCVTKEACSEAILAVVRLEELGSTRTSEVWGVICNALTGVV